MVKTSFEFQFLGFLHHISIYYDIDIDKSNNILNIEYSLDYNEISKGKLDLNKGKIILLEPKTIYENSTNKSKILKEIKIPKNKFKRIYYLLKE